MQTALFPSGLDSFFGEPKIGSRHRHGHTCTLLLSSVTCVFIELLNCWVCWDLFHAAVVVVLDIYVKD